MPYISQGENSHIYSFYPYLLILQTHSSSGLLYLFRFPNSQALYWQGFRCIDQCHSALLLLGVWGVDFFPKLPIFYLPILTCPHFMCQFLREYCIHYPCLYCQNLHANAVKPKMLQYTREVSSSIGHTMHHTRPNKIAAIMISGHQYDQIIKFARFVFRSCLAKSALSVDTPIPEQ